MFSVKSAYKVAIQRREDEKGRSAENSESLPKEISAFRWDNKYGQNVYVVSNS